MREWGWNGPLKLAACFNTDSSIGSPLRLYLSRRYHTIVIINIIYIIHHYIIIVVSVAFIVLFFKRTLQRQREQRGRTGQRRRNSASQLLPPTAHEIGRVKTHTLWNWKRQFMFLDRLWARLYEAHMYLKDRGLLCVIMVQNAFEWIERTVNG